MNKMTTGILSAVAFVAAFVLVSEKLEKRKPAVKLEDDNAHMPEENLDDQVCMTEADLDELARITEEDFENA